MRVGPLVAGIVLLVLGIVLPYFGFVLVVVGIVLIVVGAVAPKATPSAAHPEAAYWQWIVGRLYQIEVRQVAIEHRLGRLEQHAGLPPIEPSAQYPYPGYPAVPPPTPAAPPTPRPPAEARPGPVTAPAPVTATTKAPGRVAPRIPTPGMSRLELELGEKWFQRIGVIVLAIAFVFLLAIVLPRLTPGQIVGVDFATAIGLVLLSEYIYSRKGLREYAKGLAAGAFGIAYIGVWGAGFLLALPDFPWAPALAAVLVLHAAAALRYRSPLLAVEVGLLFLAWAVWLRTIDQVDPMGFAALLSVGGIAVLGLVFARPREVGGLVLTFAFGVVAVATFDLAAPFGLLPALTLGLVTAAVVALLRRRRLAFLDRELRLVAWVAGIALTYGLLIAESVPVRGRGGVDDLLILGTFVALTTALTVPEVLVKDRDLTLPFAVAVGVLSLPVPFLMARGEFALAVYPALLLAIVFVRPVKGLAWLANLAYLDLIAFASFGVGDPGAQLPGVWGLFFETAAVHAVLQERSGYLVDPAAKTLLLPTDLQLPLYVVALAGLTARAFPGAIGLGPYAVALPLALLLNRRVLLRPAAGTTAVVAAAALSMGLARWWAFEPYVRGAYAENTPILAAYHVGAGIALALWLAVRTPKEWGRVPASGLRLRASCVIALLLGLAAQDAETADLFVALPLVVALVAFYLDDALSFNAGYIALAGQSVLGALPYLEGDAVLLLPIFGAGLIALGLALELGARGDPSFARVTEVSGMALWFASAVIAFGLRVETTIAWTAAGALALAWGLRSRFALLRYAGFAGLFAVLGKVFLYDVAGLALELRILGLVVVAAALLAVSYGYARYRRRVASQP